MCHVKNQVQMANRTHPRAWLPGVAAPWQAQKRAQLSCPPTACCLLPPLVAVTTRLCSGHENRRGCCQGGTDSPFPLVSWHRFTNRFTPRLPSDSGHPGLRWSSSVTRLISLPLPCFTSVSHPVTAASLCPCVRGPSGGQPTCPEAAQGSETNSRHGREGAASSEGSAGAVDCSLPLGRLGS